jgi:hypothetical protein
VAGGDSVFRSGCTHANHFHGAKIRRHESDAANPGREGTAGKEEVRAGLHESLEEDANAQDEGEVKKHDDPINGRQIHFAILSTALDAGKSARRSLGPCWLYQSCWKFGSQFVTDGREERPCGL